MNSRVAVLPTVLLAACWYAPATRETQPVATTAGPDAPRTGTETRRVGAAPTDEAPTPRGEAPRVELPELPADTSGFQLERPMHALLPAGVRAVSRIVTHEASAGLAHVQLTLLNQLAQGASPALAELTARLVADTPMSAAGLPSLRDFVADRGGALDVTVDALTTSFVLSVPESQWRACLRHLVAAVRATPGSEPQIVRVQRELVDELRARLHADPLDAAIRRVTGVAMPGVAEWLHELQDCTAPQIAAYHRRSYGPGSAVLAMIVPGVQHAALLNGVVEDIAPWTAGQPEQPPQALPAHRVVDGLFWGAAPGPTRFSIVLDTPTPTGPAAAARLVALECLTWNGVGGRLGRQLASDFGREVALTTRTITAGEQAHVGLFTEAPPDRVVAIHESATRAARSFAHSPPTQREIEIAAQRARLRLLLEQGDPRAWLTTAVRTVFAGARQALQWSDGGFRAGPAGRSIDDWTATLQALEDPRGLDLGPALRALAERPALLVAVGGTPVEDSPRVTVIPDAFVAPTADPTGIASTEEVSGKPYLDRALAAMGGALVLAGVLGYEAESSTRSGRGPEAHDHEWLRHPDRMRRVRRVLSTTIESVIGGGSGREIAGEEQQPIPPEEVRTELAAAARHPLFLLGAFARGESSYRLISVRDVGDRKIAVLERTRPAESRIRAHIDVGSGLVRAIESQERRAIGVVHLREEYRDYRDTAGMRLPFHRTTLVDGTAQGTVTKWSSFVPRTPLAEFLEPGGPVR